MNKIFKVIWNHSTQSFMVTSELTKSKGKTKSSALGMTAAVVVAGLGAINGAYAASAVDLGTNSGITSYSEKDLKRLVISIGSEPAGSNVANKGESIYIGDGSGSARPGSIRIGMNIKDLSTGNNRDLLIGNNASTGGGGADALSTIIGHSTYGAGPSVAVGYFAQGDNATPDGAKTPFAGTTAIGAFSYAGGNVDGGVALGAAASAASANSVSIGVGAGSQTKFGTVNFGESAASSSISIGDYSAARSKGSIAIGTNTTTGIQTSNLYPDKGAHNAIAIGNNTTSLSSFSVALGSGAQAGVYEQDMINRVNSDLTNINNLISTLEEKIAQFKTDGKVGNFNGRTDIASPNLSPTDADEVNVTFANLEKAKLVKKRLENDLTREGVGRNKQRENAIAIGNQTKALALNTIAVGNHSSATGVNSTTIGNEANATHANATAIGYKATALADNSIAFGVTANATGKNAMAQGTNANASAESANALGLNASASGVNATAIAGNASASGVNSIAFGVRSVATQLAAVALGEQARAEGEKAIAIGNQANATQRMTVAIGDLAKATAEYGFAAGAQSNATARYATALGANSNATNEFATAVGKSATASGRMASAVGVDANATGANSAAFGSKANAAGASGVAIGNGAAAGRNEDTAASQTALNDAIAIGTGAKSVGGHASIAFGKGSNATHNNAIATGTDAKALEASAIAMGQNATASNIHSLALGTNATANLDRSVALGAYSTVSEATPTNQATVGGITYSGFAGNDPAKGDVVSVGNGDRKRQIQNVAAGQISAESTDAINGSQLFAVLEQSKWKLSTSQDDASKQDVGDINLNDEVIIDGKGVIKVTNTKESKNVSKVHIAVETQAVNSNADGKADTSGNSQTGGTANNAPNLTALATAGDVINAVNNSFWKVSEGTAANKKDDVKAGDNVVFANGTGTVATVENTDGVNTIVKYSVDKGDIQVDEKTGAVSTQAGDDGNKVATTADVVDAISKSGFKLKASATTEGAEEDSTLEEEVINPSETVEIVAGKNLKVKQDNNGKITLSTKDDVSFTNVNATNLTSDTIKVPTGTGSNPITINKDGIDMANKPITNVNNGLTTYAAGTPTAGLVDLSKPTDGSAPKVADSTVATVGDLRNMGWVVSSDKTTTTTEGQPNTNAFNNQVKNAGEVKFVGTGAAKVSGEEKEGVNVITVHVDPAKAPETAQISTNVTTGKAGTGADGSETPPNSTALATAGDVINAVNNSFWKVSEGTAANKKDDVKAGDNVVFANGTGTVATVENTDGVNTIVKYSVDKGDIQVDETTGKVTQKPGEGDDKVATTGDVVDAISKSGFKLTAQGKDGSIVNPSETVDLNNTDGNIKITKSDKDNNVTFNLNNTVKLGDAATNPTGSQLTIDGDKGVISGLNTTLQAVPNNQNLAAPTITDAQKNQAATLGDVLNVGWNLKENNTEKDFVKAYDTVNFVNGTGTTANVSMNNDGTVANVTFNVNNTTLNVNEDVTKADAGKVASPTGDDAKKFVTAGDLATVMNKTGFTLKTSATTDGEKDTASTKDELINAGDVVDIEAGKNIKVKQAANGKITVSTKDDVTFNNVIAKQGITLGEGTNATRITPTDKGLNFSTNNQPTVLGGVTSGLDTIKTGNPTGLVDLSKPTDGSAPKVADSTVATVGDLRNMGWVVSADKTTGDLGNAYNDQVKNANEVKFVGTNLATVSGKTENGVRTITVDVNAQNTVNSAQLPVVYTTADGTRVVKANDGKFYPADEVEADGTPKATAAAKEVAPKDVIASMNSGSDKTNEPTTLANVKSHLPSVNDTAKTVTPVGGVAAAAEINKAPLTAQQAAKLAQNSANHAATLGDVLNAGWNLQGNGSAVDFVRPFDTINFKDGANTKLVASSNGTTSELAVNVVGLPVSYTTQDGVPVAKVGDTFYEMKEDGTPDLTKPVEADKLVANAINPTAKPNEKGAPITLGNIKSGVGSLDGSNRGDKTTSPTAIDALSPLGTALKDAYNGLADLVNAPQNNAVTAADLRNLGWVVSATGNNYADDVRHANEVRFVGKGLAKVEGQTTADGVREITVSVETGAVVPTQAVDNAGNPVTKVGDKYYKTADIDPATGKPKAGVTEVAKADVTETPNSGAGLVTGNQVADAIQTSGFVIGKQTDTLAAADFKNEDERVNPDDNVRFADGNNTNVKLATKETTDASGKKVTTTTVKVDVTGLPISYTDENGTPVVKVGDKFFTVDAEGNPTTTEVPKDKLSTNLVNATAAPNEKGEPTKLGNVADGAVNETSNDAVNGSQLYAVGNATANMLGGNTTVNPTTGAPEGFSKDLNTTGGTATTADYKPTNPATNVADAIDNLNTYVNAGWKVGDTNGDVVERIAPNDQVNFVDSNTISAKVEANNQGGANVSFEVKTGTLGGTNGSTTGSGGFVTAGQVADAINNSGFNLKTSATAEGQKVSGTDELINPTDSVEMIAGKNLTVKQEANGKVTYATAENVSFTTVNSTTVVVGSPADPNNSTTLTSGNGGLNVGGDKISGVADGDISPTSNQVINGKQLNNFAKVNGDNVNTTPDGSINLVNGNGTTVSTNKAGEIQVNVNNTDLTVADNGTINVQDPTGTGANYVNATTVAKAVNNVSWNVGSGEVENTNGKSTYTANADSKVKASETLKVRAGRNIEISGKGKEIDIAVSDTPEFTSVKTGDTLVDNNGITINNGAEGNAVSLTKNGLNNGGNRITNVKAGQADTDAVNVGQLKGAVNHLNNKINRNNREARAGIAGSNAAAGLPQVYIPGKSMVAASAGTFKGESALAVGYSRASDNGKLILKLQGNANTRGDVGGSVGIGYQW